MKDIILFDFDWTLVILDVNWDRLLKRLRTLFHNYGSDIGSKNIIYNTFLLSKQLEKAADNRAVLKNAYRIIKKEELLGAEKAKIINNSKNLIKNLKQKFVTMSK